MLRGAFSQRGQVLIIFVFAIIGLVAMTGLAIDGGNVYSDRRHAQNAADTASLAAAVVKIKQEKDGSVGCTDLTTPTTCGALVQNAALDMARTNGYSSDIIHDTVEVHIPPTDGPYSDCSQPTFNCRDYIQVIITTNVDTWFAKVLGVRQLHNRVEAVALAKYRAHTTLGGGNTLVELNPSSSNCGGDVVLGGDGSLTLEGGGIYVNSDNTRCAVKDTSCMNVYLLPGPDGNTATISGRAGPAGMTFSGSCHNRPAFGYSSTLFPWPGDHVFDTPAECGTRGTYTTSATSTTYNPGAYGTFPVLGSTDSVLQPGVYCVTDFQNTHNITGDGVLIYIKPTGTISMSGGTVHLTAPTSGIYQNWLIYQDWNDSSSVKACNYTGGASDYITGAIYAPYCNFTLSGTSSGTGIYAQISAYTLAITGTTNLRFVGDSSFLPQIPEQEKTGLTR